MKYKVSDNRVILFFINAKEYEQKNAFCFFPIGQTWCITILDMIQQIEKLRRGEDLPQVGFDTISLRIGQMKLEFPHTESTGLRLILPTSISIEVRFTQKISNTAN